MVYRRPVGNKVTLPEKFRVTFGPPNTAVDDGCVTVKASSSEPAKWGGKQKRWRARNEQETE